MRDATASPVASKRVWAMVVSATEDAGVVEVVVEAALDAAGVALHQNAMALGVFHVEPDVEEAALVEQIHGDVAEDDLAVGGGGADGGEGAAALRLGLRRRRAAWASLPSTQRRHFQAGRLGGEAPRRAVMISAQALMATISTRSISPAVEAGAGRAGAVGDPLHLLQVFLVVAAEEERVDEGAGRLPAVGGRLGTLPLGEAADLGRDLRRQEPAVLHAALVRLALDVQDDPAGLRVAVGGAVALHRGGVGLEVRRRRGRGPGRERRRCAEQRPGRGRAGVA